MDTLKTVGHVLEDDMPRDAVHIAMVPCILTTDTWAGTWVRLKAGPSGNYYAHKIIYRDIDIDTEEGTLEGAHGIIDPFLDVYPEAGTRVWCFLKPGSITSLTHMWSHPELPDLEKPKPTNDPQKRSMLWLEEYAVQLDVPLKDILEVAHASARSDSPGYDYYYTFQNRDNPGLDPQFWAHYEIAFGVHVPENSQTNFFTCSC